MIKYFVRTTNNRNFEYDLKYTKLVDTKCKPVESFINQLKYISSWDSVLLEDDLILCEDFKNKIEDVIKQYPNKIINFFTRPNDYFTTHESSIFAYNQCTYYPKGITKQIAIKMEEGFKKNPRAQYDVLENNALKELGITHIQYRPCLVQHLDKDSLVGNYANGYRRTPYFIDYLKELNIDYKEAFETKNRNRLYDLLTTNKKRNFDFPIAIKAINKK